jgi:hypothetical protein
MRTDESFTLLSPSISFPEAGFERRKGALVFVLRETPMIEQSTPAVHTHGRPFPWFCPNCRKKEVRRATIPYQCQRFFRGQPIAVVLSALEVPKCGNCGEVNFTYETEEQINRAYEAQTAAFRNGQPSKDDVIDAEFEVKK